jgi:alpha-L-fucosidase
MNKQPDHERRIEQFRDLRLGMFVHWGMSSVLGRGEQIMARDLMPLAEYDPYAQQFRPDADWADRLAQTAKQVGLKYVVLTTRHHDGYCLFDTATHGFNAARTGPGRDLVAEYVAACRKAGLTVGFYYSLMSWRWRGYWSPERYPKDLPAMVDEVHAQVRELMTNYGPVDILWYDGAGVPGRQAHGMWGGAPIEATPAAFWRSEELNAMARELQPQILINNRAGVPEDFGTPEQRISTEGAGRPWETCMTVNYAPGWGYLPQSVANKTAGEVLFNLVDAVRLGGNFLFNVGPRPDGAIDEREGDVLAEIGRWLEVHGAAVYGTRPAEVYDLSLGRVQGPMFHYGMWTCKGNTGYLTLFYYPGETVVISKIGPRPTRARLLTTGAPLSLTPASNGRTVIGGLPALCPDPLAAVIEVEFEGPPYAITQIDADWLEGTFSSA